MSLPITASITSLISPSGRAGSILRQGAVWIGAPLILALLIWQGVTAAGNPNPETATPDSFPAVLDIAVLVFREGLECILVLSAVTAGLSKSGERCHGPVAAGVGTAIAATLATWFVAVGIVDDLTKNFPALSVQAGTGLLAIVVLLVVMNWFFHKVYWTGWISMHTKKKRELVETVERTPDSRTRFLFGMALLGFTSLYREGFEVVLFLQRYRLKFGDEPVFYGVAIGSVLTAVVAVLTVLAHRKLPYRRMLVFTGILLGLVLLVMVGEEAQEMQLAGWLSTTEIPGLSGAIPAWMGLWFSVYPTVETITAQVLAAILVAGSYFAVGVRSKRRAQNRVDRATPQRNSAVRNSL